MNIVLEILYALAAMATIADFLVLLWKEYKRQRMAKGEKRKEPAGTGSS